MNGGKTTEKLYPMELLSSCLVFIYLLLSKKQNTKTYVLSTLIKEL